MAELIDYLRSVNPPQAVLDELAAKATAPLLGNAVYQLEGHKPDVAAMAYTKGEARTKIIALIGRKIKPGEKVAKIKDL